METITNKGWKNKKRHRLDPATVGLGNNIGLIILKKHGRNFVPLKDVKTRQHWVLIFIIAKSLVKKLFLHVILAINETKHLI